MVVDFGVRQSTIYGGINRGVANVQKIAPFLWFNDNAEEAVKCYGWQVVSMLDPQKTKNVIKGLFTKTKGESSCKFNRI